MNEQRARYIVKSGVIPGEIDSVDLWRAEGYLEALKKIEPLIEAVENMNRGIVETHGRMSVSHERLVDILESLKAFKADA